VGTRHDRLARRAIDGGAEAKELEALFAELRFADPAKAVSLWERLVPRDGAEAPPPGNVANLLAELASSSDPDMALINLARFVESRIAPARFLHSLFLARPIARLFVTIFSCSYFLTEILARNPGYLSWLVEENTLERTKAFSAYRFELSRQIEPFRDPRRRINSLKRYFRRETLRIGARDLMGLAGVEDVTAELSFLADAIVETVACMAFEELAPGEGPGETAWSFDTAVPYHRFAVISLGKLGGTELNYSSDIDLMYVCEATEGERERAFYDHLARRVTEYLSAPTEEGTLYRVDLRLRPDGDSGPLVVTLADHLDYLQRRAKPWELQSLIKARLSAGNRPVGDAFVDNCTKAIYSPAPSIDSLDEIVTMRERWMSYLSDEERAGNIKLMAGGIRDIEFIAQGIQLTHGRSRPGIRSRNTLESLERLARSGLLSAEAKETLDRSYRLFRTVEHRMQMLRNVRTHTIPSSETDLAKTAERVCRSALRGITPENFTAELGRSLAEVEHLFDGCFRNRLPGEIPLLLSLPASDRAVEEILSKYGFRGGEEAHRFLSALVFGDFPRLEGIETLASAAKFLPGVLERVSLAPDPSLALKNLVRIVKATGAVRSTLELLGGGGDLLRLLLAIAALSTKLSETLASRIEILDLLAEGAPPGNAPDPKAKDALRLLARRHEESLLFIHSQYPIPKNGPETLGPLFAEASERALGALFERNARGAGGLAIVAAGSLATRGARFGSDLDLIAVTADERAAAPEADFVRGMIDDARAIPLGAIDMRLRGEGEGAPLVQTLDYCESYLQTRASLWELLAYSKCRFLCGSALTGRAFEEMLAHTLPVAFGRDGWRARLDEARAELEAISKGPWDVKHAAGGLYDIDFLLSAARLRGVVATPPSADLRPALDELRSAGLLAAEDADALLAAYRLFWTIEHAAALHGIPFPPLPEREEFFESYFSRLFGAGAPEGIAVLERLEGTRNDIRVIYERLMPRIR
jgi:[glutamine synthetase] adenylyltransferase / [glutamine synthetase]-adenylyl-L-tyrosine phosphorylase